MRVRSGGSSWTLRTEPLCEMSTEKARTSAGMSGDGSQALGIFASITAALETTQTDITNITAQTGAGTCHGCIQLRLPLTDVDGRAATQVTVNDVQLSDGELQLELDVEIADSASATDGNPNVSTGDTTNAILNVENSSRCGALDQSPDQQIESNSETQSSERTQSSVQRQQSQQSPVENNTVVAAESDSEDSRPTYQQPEALAEVYDENATFEEMKAELGVDVTAQTVRKYMIKHGIHDPQPRTDRLLESIRVSEPEITNTVAGGNMDGS